MSRDNFYVVSEELNSVETPNITSTSTLVVCVSEELNSVETPYIVEDAAKLLKFQKNLIVWKLHSVSPSSPEQHTVSEELNSVETPCEPTILRKWHRTFQKNLIVWKRGSGHFRDFMISRFRRT